MSEKVLIQENIRLLRIIHFSMLLGSLLFLIVIRFVVIDESEIKAVSENQNIIFGLAILVTIGIIISFILRNRYLDKFHKQSISLESVINLRNGLILCWAIVDILSNLSILAYLFYGGYTPLVSALAGLLILYFMKPDFSKIQI